MYVVCLFNQDVQKLLAVASSRPGTFIMLVVMPSMIGGVCVYGGKTVFSYCVSVYVCIEETTRNHCGRMAMSERERKREAGVKGRTQALVLNEEI